MSEKIPYYFIPIPWEFFTDEFIDDPVKLKMIRYIFRRMRSVPNIFEFKNNRKHTEVYLDSHEFVFGQNACADEIGSSHKAVWSRMNEWMNRGYFTLVTEKSRSTYSVYRLVTSSLNQISGNKEISQKTSVSVSQLESQFGHKTVSQFGVAVIQSKPHPEQDSIKNKSSSSVLQMESQFGHKTVYNDKNDKNDQSDKRDTYKNGNQERCTRDIVLDSSSLFKSSPIVPIVFHPSTYKLKDGQKLSKRMQQAILKYSPANYEKLKRNVFFYEKYVQDGGQIRTTHERTLQDFFNKDLAQKHEWRLKNELFFKMISTNWKTVKYKLFKTVVKIGDESISLDLPEESFYLAVEEEFNKNSRNGEKFNEY